MKSKLPEGWEVVDLSRVAKFHQGYGFPKDIQGNKIGDYPFYKVGDISKNIKAGNRHLILCDNFIDENVLLKLKAKPYPVNTIVFAKIGEGLKLNRRGIIKTPGVVDNNAMGLKAIENLCDDLYLYHFFNTVKLEDYAKATTVPSVRKSEIEGIQFPLPPLKTQQAIVSKIEELFSDIDKGIEDLQIAQQQLKTYRQSVLKWAFEGKFTNENVKEGELPKGWEIVDMSKVIEKPKYGTSKKCDYAIDGMGVLRIPNIAKGIVDSSDLKFAKFDDKEIEAYSLKEGDILTIRSNGSVDLVGKCALISKKDEEYLYAGYLIRLRPIITKINPKYLIKILSSIDLRNQIEDKAKSTSGVNNINSEELSTLKIQLPSLEEQYIIVQEIESRLSVADKMEESINESLKQAEALRQSILKKAFSGELIQEVVQEKVQKPKNQYFFQMQFIGKVASISKKNKIEHGEMTIAKYTYLADKLFGIPTGFEFNRWHLGPYPPAIKKVVNNKQYFQRSGNHIEVVNESTLFKITNNYTALIDDAVSSLVGIFSKYKTPAERAHKTELLATVCKVIEDIKTTEFMLVRASMREWKIDLKTSAFKNKAEKFNEEETKSCIEFIIGKGWVEKLI